MKKVFFITICNFLYVSRAFAENNGASKEVIFMPLSDFIMVIAIIAGPILAVQAQKWIENKGSKKEKKLHIFRSLMATRATYLDPLHVQALNLIHIDYDLDKDKNVIDAWNLYLDHLYDKPSKSGSEAWNLKSSDLLTDLLFEMAKSLKFSFDKVFIKKGCYAPQKFADMDYEHQLIRRGAVEVLTGTKPLIINMISSDEAIKEQESLRKLMLEHYEGKRPLTIRIVNDENKTR